MYYIYRRRCWHFKSGRAPLQVKDDSGMCTGWGCMVGSLHNRPTCRARLKAELLQAVECTISLAAARCVFSCFSNTWVPMQSGNETNDSRKSGPAKAGPARVATLPLYTLTCVVRARYNCVGACMPLRVHVHIAHACEILTGALQLCDRASKQIPTVKTLLASTYTNTLPVYTVRTHS